MENRDFIPITTFLFENVLRKCQPIQFVAFFPGPTHFSVSTRSIYLFLFFNLRHTVNTLGRNFLSSLALVGRLFSPSEIAIGELVGWPLPGQDNVLLSWYLSFFPVIFFPPYNLL